MENSNRRLAPTLLAFIALVCAAGCSGSSSTPAPVIDSLGPTSGIATTTVLVAGSNFGLSQDQSIVSIGGVLATPTSWSDTAIAFDVPDAVYPSVAEVVVTVGGKTSNPTSFDVALPRTVYVNQDDTTANSVAAFSLADDGTPTELAGSPYPTGDVSAGFVGDASSVTVNRATRRVFATSNATVAVYDIDPVTGELAAVSGSPFSSGGSQSYGITVNAAGTRAFVANCGDGTVSVLNVDADGGLTPVAGSPFAVSSNCPDTPQLLQGETLLTVTDELSNVSVFQVDAGSGALTAVTGSPFAAGFAGRGSRADPSGTWLYFPDPTDGTLHVYAFAATSGVPAEIAGSPFASGSTGGTLGGVAFPPDGARAYVGNFDLNEVVAFSVSGGAPTPVTGSPFEVAGATAMTSLAVARDDSLLVAADEDSVTLSVFSIGADGSIAPVTGSPFAADIGSASGVSIGE